MTSFGREGIRRVRPGGISGMFASYRRRNNHHRIITIPIIARHRRLQPDGRLPNASYRHIRGILPVETQCPGKRGIQTLY